MSSARRLAAAFAVVGAGVLAYAVPASATGDGVDHSCLKSDSHAAVAGNLTVVAMDVEAASATVQAERPFCEPMKVVLSTYVVPETWQPADGWSEAAAPQDAYDSDVAVVEGDGPVRLHAEVTDCGAMQTDLYWWGPKGIVGKVTYPEGRAGVFLAGGLWARLDEQGKVIQCKPETPSPSPTAPPTTAPPTTAAPTTSAPPPTASPTEGLGAPVVIPVHIPPPPPPPVLAETGSNSTVPIVGVGILLLGAGIGLSVVGRRRTA